MATKPSNQRGSSESATLASIRRGGVQSADITDDSPLLDNGPGTDVSEVDDEDAESAVVYGQKVAQFVIDRKYGPNTVELVQWIAGSSLDTRDLNVVIIEQMAARFAQAETADEILDPFGTVKGQDMLNRPLWVTGCTFLDSDMAEGFPWYASLVVTDQETGRSRVVTVGGEKLVMTAAALSRQEMWPQAVKIVRSDKPTKAGFYPLDLVPA